MKAILLLSFTLLYSGESAWYDGPKCSVQSKSYTLEDTQRTWVDWPGISYDSGLGCWSDDLSCGSVRYQGSFVKRYRRWFSNQYYNETYTYSSEAKRCTGADACTQLAGGQNNCSYGQYTYQAWRPRSCDNTTDYDAITEDHDVNLYFDCCNDADYCNRDVDYSTSSCSYSASLSNYMTELNVCWNNYKYEFMEDLLCDAEKGDILSYSDNCTEADGSWKSTVRALRAGNCSYRVTCAPELQQLLTDFSSCACTAASSNGYSGEFIGSAMEANWKRFCPEIDVECASDGLVRVLRHYYLARFKFRVAVATAITEEIKANIIRLIAQRLNVHQDAVTVYEDTSSTTRRMLQTTTSYNVDVETQDTSTSTYVYNLLTTQETDIQSDIETATGATLSGVSTEKDEADDVNTGTYESGTSTTSTSTTREPSAASVVDLAFSVIAAVIFVFVY
eukprot:CAMPEP_0197039672 /NCGR_PEP_ID=MMETSP1384-20130603/16462_1 /TAXON_ID=29189 /ORGANISM="Ammonia sp." /LENGTH=447 /DNA_ID=CAMNT_0042470311 /DNA_START=35 /DNA_END=1378 /DNA_ORIENTATION=+